MSTVLMKDVKSGHFCKTCFGVRCTCAWSFDVYSTSRSDSLHTHARTRLRRRKTVKLTAYSIDMGKTAPTLCHTIVQVQLSTINVYPLNTLTFHPLQRPRFPCSAFPWPGQSSPTLSHSLSLTQSILYPDYSTILPHNHPVSLIRLFRDPFPH